MTKSLGSRDREVVTSMLCYADIDTDIDIAMSRDHGDGKGLDIPATAWKSI